MEKLKFLFILVREGYSKKIIDVLINEQYTSFITFFFADGIKKSYFLDVLGDEKKREIIFAIVKESKYQEVYTFLNNCFLFEKDMNGMLLTFELFSIAGTKAYRFLTNYGGVK